jgi:hypothetical protein
VKIWCHPLNIKCELRGSCHNLLSLKEKMTKHESKTDFVCIFSNILKLKLNKKAI